MPKLPQEERLTQKFDSSSFSNKKIYLIVVLVSVLAGLGTGYYLSTSGSAGSSSPGTLITKTNEPPKSASQDTQTFKDWAEGTLKAKPTPKAGQTYAEGTHVLVQASGQTVDLTSSVVDLSKYEGKKVKVYGQTNKGASSAWLMDVGKIQEQ